MDHDSTEDLLMAVARSMRGSFVQALAEYDVTPAQARALRAATQPDPIRLSELAQRLRIAPRSATEVVDALEERQLVERRPDPRDRRATGVVPTERGRRLQAEIGEARRLATSHTLARLSEADRAELDRLLRLLLDRDTSAPAPPATPS